MVLGKFSAGRPKIWIIVGQGSIALAVGAGRVLFGHLYSLGGGRVVRRCWVNFQCRGVLLIWNIVVGWLFGV